MIFSLIIDALNTLKNERIFLLEKIYIDDFKFINLSCDESSDYVRTNFFNVLGNTNLELNNWIKIYKEIKEENSDRTKRVFIRIRRYLLIKVILSNGSFMYLFEIDKKEKEAYLGFILNMNKEVDKNTLFDIVGTHPIWPPRAFTFGQLTHNDLASVRIPKRATKSL